jgi:GNAT superfamily N-acetyltransferase
MLDRWYRSLRLKLTLDEFHRLPRNSAFKYEYIGGEAWLTPRPKTFNGLLDLNPVDASLTHQIDGEEFRFRPLTAGDWDELPAVFAAAFQRVQPFISLDDNERLEASRECLEQTRSGGDGPLIDQASFVAEPSDGQIAGAILITLIPRVPEGEWWDAKWEMLPTNDHARRLLGRPHLTWIFVAPHYAGEGLGTALLHQSINALVVQGYTDLASTFLVGNDSSTLWHWRNGFRLLPYPGSARVLRQRLAPQADPRTAPGES